MYVRARREKGRLGEILCSGKSGPDRQSAGHGTGQSRGTGKRGEIAPNSKPQIDPLHASQPATKRRNGSSIVRFIGASIALRPCRKRPFFEFSLCSSRACLGKIMHFIYKWLKNGRFPYVTRRLLPACNLWLVRTAAVSRCGRPAETSFFYFSMFVLNLSWQMFGFQ